MLIKKSRIVSALIAFLLLAAIPATVAGQEPSAASPEGLPLTASHAGEYLSVDQAEGGYQRLAGFVQGMYFIAVKPYTQQSRDKLYVSIKMYASQYVGHYTGSIGLYFEAVEQIEPNVFQDSHGNLIRFVQQNGQTTGLFLNDAEYERKPAAGISTRVDITVYALYAAMLYSGVGLISIVIGFVKDKLGKWPRFAATRLHSALCLLLFLLCANNILLLFYPVEEMSLALSRACLIFNMAGSGAAVALGVGLCLTWKRGELSGKQKAAYIATGCFWAVLLVVIIAWGLYR